MTGYRSLPVVPDGPLAFRYRIRRLGALVGLVPAGLLAAGSYFALHDNTTTTRGVVGFAAAVLAAPALLAFGAPLATGSSKLVLAAAVSMFLWLAIGMVAARRATRSPVATWRDFWREFFWMAGGVWLGVVIALVVVQVTVGGALL